ncbi:MAG: outer membrane lipid asymmetry maintenance protein MlaD [Rhodospirillales bacterium]|nr:outer membrane lipid asymmetry maintenance protein MlaD [Rhodospirillales bacterium]MCW8861425.1 outer membrane lipid asymmetry maintenance protein MlaD [Rhodospirillales bacterium]MCW8953063.1 outer membrane lipid asymmetry maintenance protein MlaD [Rhodospirillales bacterium]MCW8970370.1 outer membrane lipid asymmetry maintenance protein MlaD [Rhodospirillales bacterium]MCW9001323.1 outer membrane lipid asymmetry maintenance protein MlaD [Rhodospirillales bacterium]
MGRTLVETVMGAVVLLVAGMFVYFAYNMAEVRAIQGYELKASFYKIGGLKKGADVQVSGIKVGTVTELGLDPQTYDAVITMSVSTDVRLPTDSAASIASEGMLGDKFVRLEPGRESTRIEAGGRIMKTKDYRSLEDQVGEIIFLATGGDEGKK